MQINEPSILLEEVVIPENSSQIEQFHLFKFSGESFSIVDGFEKEDNPCFVVLN